MKVRKRRRPGGAETWVMDFRIGGQRHLRTIPNVRSRKEAVEVAETVFAQLKHREMLGEWTPPTRAEKCLTLAATLNIGRERPGIAETTKRLHDTSARHLLDYFGAEKRVASLTRGDLDGFIQARLNAKAAPRTINLSLGCLRTALQRTVQTRRLSRSPVTVKLIPEPRIERPTLTDNEIVRLCKTATARGIGDEVTLLLCAALRKGELFRMRWGEVDLTDATLRVRSTKRGGAGSVREDVIPLSEPALVVLHNRAMVAFDGNPPPEALVFGILPSERDSRRATRRKGAPGHSEGIQTLVRYRFRNILKLAAKDASISWADRLRPHDLRHAGASFLLRHGAAIQDVSRLLRHSKATTTLDVYAHALPSGLRDAAEMLGKPLTARVVTIASCESVRPDGDQAPKVPSPSTGVKSVTG